MISFSDTLIKIAKRLVGEQIELDLFIEYYCALIVLSHKFRTAFIVIFLFIGDKQEHYGQPGQDPYGRKDFY